MKSNRKRAALLLAGITASIAFVAGAALAAPSDHAGDPADWGPPLAALCDDPVLGAAQGYNVIDDPVNGAFDGGLLYGTNGPDLILANSGNDIVSCHGISFLNKSRDG